MTATPRNVWLEVGAVALIVLSFVIGQITPDPTSFGITLLAARWLGVVTGVIAIILRYLPTPTPTQNGAPAGADKMSGAIGIAGLNIGSGLATWIEQNQATPLSDENYLTPDYRQSAVSIQIADSTGRPVRTLVGWDRSGGLLPPGPGVAVMPTLPVPPPPAPPPPTPTPDEHQIELANYQGTDQTCGERVITEACMEDGFLPVDPTAGKALVDELVGQLGVSPAQESTFGGTTLQQELALILYAGQKFGKQTKSTGPWVTPDMAASVIADPQWTHVAIAEYNMLGFQEAHWLLRRKDDKGDSQFIHLIDSDLALDGDPDVWSYDDVKNALIGAIAWTWT